MPKHNELKFPENLALSKPQAFSRFTSSSGFIKQFYPHLKEAFSFKSDVKKALNKNKQAFEDAKVLREYINNSALKRDVNRGFKLVFPNEKGNHITLPNGGSLPLDPKDKSVIFDREDEDYSIDDQIADAISYMINKPPKLQPDQIVKLLSTSQGFFQPGISYAMNHLNVNLPDKDKGQMVSWGASHNIHDASFYKTKKGEIGAIASYNLYCIQNAERPETYYYKLKGEDRLISTNDPGIQMKLMQADQNQDPAKRNNALTITINDTTVDNLGNTVELPPKEVTIEPICNFDTSLTFTAGHQDIEFDLQFSSFSNQVKRHDPVLDRIMEVHHIAAEISDYEGEISNNLALKYLHHNQDLASINFNVSPDRFNELSKALERTLQNEITLITTNRKMSTVEKQSQLADIFKTFSEIAHPDARPENLAKMQSEAKAFLSLKLMATTVLSPNKSHAFGVGHYNLFKSSENPIRKKVETINNPADLVQYLQEVQNKKSGLKKEVKDALSHIVNDYNRKTKVEPEPEKQRKHKKG